MLLDIHASKTLLLDRTGWESEMKNILGEVKSGRSLINNTLTTTPNTGWECGTVYVKGQSKPSEGALPSKWWCYGWTPGQPLITLNSDYIIRDRLLKLSEKQCERNTKFYKVLIEALEQKNPDGTAIPPGHPHPWAGFSRSLWDAGAPASGSDPQWGGVGTPLLSRRIRTPGSPVPGTKQGTCSHTEEREVACAARECKGAWKYRGHYLQKGVWRFVGLY